MTEEKQAPLMTLTVETKRLDGWGISVTTPQLIEIRQSSIQAASGNQPSVIAVPRKPVIEMAIEDLEKILAELRMMLGEGQE